MDFSKLPPSCCRKISWSFLQSFLVGYLALAGFFIFIAFVAGLLFTFFLAGISRVWWILTKVFLELPERFLEPYRIIFFRLVGIHVKGSCRTLESIHVKGSVGSGEDRKKWEEDKEEEEEEEVL